MKRISPEPTHTDPPVSPEAKTDSKWRASTLGEEVDLLYGKSLPAANRKEGGVPVYGSNGFVGTHSVAAARGPGIIVGRKGTVGAVVYSQEDFWPIDTTYYVHNKNAHNWRFLFYLLSQSGLSELNSHSAVPGLNRESAYPIQWSIPPRAEQEQIAAVLWKLQRAVATQDRLIAATRDLKQAAMQRFFAHGLRGEPLKETDIGPLPESWQVTPFSELREFVQYGTSSKCGYERNGRPVIRIPNVIDGRVDTKDMKWAELPAKEIDSYELADGDLIFIRTNGVIARIGSCAVFRGEPAGALFASYLIRARPNERLYPDFFRYYSMTSQGRAQLAGRASAAADGKFNINTQLINSVLVPLPAPDEQRGIAAALATIDRKLAHHQRKRTALNDLFQTALHKLMTAQIRVADLDIDTSEIMAPPR